MTTNREFKVQVRRYGEEKWIDLYRPDDSVVEPFSTIEAARVVGETYFRQHVDLYKEKFMMKDPTYKRHHLAQMRIVAREIGDWREVANADITD